MTRIYRLALSLLILSAETGSLQAAFAAHDASRTNRAAITGDYFEELRPDVLMGGPGSCVTEEIAVAAGYVVVTDDSWSVHHLCRSALGPAHANNRRRRINRINTQAGYGEIKGDQTMHNDGLPMADVEIITSPKWIRVFFGGQVIASSRQVKLKRGYPLRYYFPSEDVNMSALQAAEGEDLWDVKVGDAVAERAAFSDAEDERLADHITFRWQDMGAWFEEDEQVHTHPRDPYVRLETLHSARHVRVVLAGEVVAETRRPVLLFETGLPTRYYMPRTDARIDFLVPSDSHTSCPYKGEASYFSLKVGDAFVEDAVWYYPFPDSEVSKIQSLICFYPEKVDEFWVDGEKIELG